MSLPSLVCCFLLLLRNRGDPGRPSDNREITDTRDLIRAVGLRVGFKLHSNCAAHRALLRQPEAPSLHFPRLAACTGRKPPVSVTATATATERPDWYAGTCRPRSNETERRVDPHFLVEHDRDADRG